MIYNYLIYRIKSVNEHGVHSPFIFDLLLSTIYNRKEFYAYRKIENIRQEMLLSGQNVHCIELGAGSQVLNKPSKTVGQIARSAAKSPKFGQLLFRLVDHFQPENVLELGTSLGISTAYMAVASSKAEIHTIEGCPEVAAIARRNFKNASLKNIDLTVGSFDDVLPGILKQMQRVDLVFFDGNHRKEPTLNYFKQCLEKAVETSVFIFDDIHWSPDMKSAWEEIKENERVTVTLDLFYLGIVFFRKEQVKEHFVIRY